MSKMRKTVIAAVFCLAIMLCGCELKAQDTSNNTVMETTRTNVEVTGETTEVDLSSLSSGESLVLSKGGTYVLSGVAKNSQIYVDGADGEFTLVLDGASIAFSGDGGAICCVKAGDLNIMLKEGTENYVSDSVANSSNGAIYVKSADLTISGEGSLSVESVSNGIFNTKDLTVESGNITIKSQDSGIVAKSSITISGGNISIDSVSDGIKSKGSTDENDNVIDGTGDVIICGGEITMNTEKDGIQGNNDVKITGGKINIKTTGEEIDEEDSSSQGGFLGRMGGGMDQSLPSVNSKGIKAENQIYISGGEITVNSTGHAIKSSGDVIIEGDASLSLDAFFEGTNGKGIKAEDTLTVSGGMIRISRSYEGLESKNKVEITGGDIELSASDDGIQANSVVLMNGGYVFLNAEGDGIDSNGDIEIGGGTLIIAGPTSNNNGALDCGDSNNHISVTGGVLVAYGSIGMSAYPSAQFSTQNCLGIGLQMEQGSTVGICSEDGTPIIAIELQKTAQSVCISTSGIETGKTYKVLTGVTPDGDARNGVYEGFSGGSEQASLEVSSTLTTFGANAGGGGMHGGMKPQNGYFGGGEGGKRPPNGNSGEAEMMPPNGNANS